MIVRTAWALATAVLLLAAGTAHAGFHSVDGTLNFDDTKDAVNPALADVGGVPYVAWTEQASNLGGLILVKRFDGTNWVPVGGSLNADATKNAGFPMITSVGGVPYATWAESNGTRLQVRAARFNGTSWEAVGGSLNIDTNQAGTEPAIASVGGVPYITWVESTATPNLTKVYVRRLNASGTTWDPVGSALNVDAAKPGFGPRVADVGGVAHVTWFEGVGGSAQQVYVRRLNSNGTTWDLVGPSSLNIDATQSAVRSNIAAIGGVPYVAWREPNGADQIHVKRFDGTNWVPVGGVLNVDPNKLTFFTPGIADVAGVPYVTWEESATPAAQTVVRRFDGTDWVSVGGISNPDPARTAQTPAIATVGGLPYVAWSDSAGSDGKIRVARQLSPTCSASSLAVGHDTPITVPLSCVDASGLAIAANPAHGTLSAIDAVAGTVTYTPSRGYSGADSFGFRGTDGPLTSPVATVGLTVAGGPPSSVAAISRLRINPRRFRAGSRGPSAARKRKRRTGTKVSYRDTQAARTTFTVRQPRRGVRRGRKCAKPRHGRRIPRSRRCTRNVAVGRFTHRDRAGSNSFRFTGRVRGRKLRPGRYRLEAVPRLAGRKGRKTRAAFRIVR